MRLHIGYLLSLEDSERTRAACLRYLQSCFIYFYPERPEIVGQVQQTAKNLGGELEIPHLSWKYSWVKNVFGWALAKRLQILLPRARWSFLKSWDKTIFFFEDRGFAENFERINAG